jgi:hypothetical protein
MPVHRRSDIQIEIEATKQPPMMVEGVKIRLGPVYTLFVTATITRTLERADQARLAAVLDSIDDAYPFNPHDGVLLFVSYGLPYFRAIPAALVAAHMPRLAHDPARWVIEEAVPSPTDVSPLNPGVSKLHFNVPVRIESNDVLFTIRSDSLPRCEAVAERLFAAGLPLALTSSRVMFEGEGMPRATAETHHLPYAQRIHPRSPMWMGFFDQQVGGAGPPAITTFAGNPSARVTSARPGDYFDLGSVQHLSHVILDLVAFYADDEPFTERCQYMFRSNPIPSVGNPHDQFTDGGGPSALANVFAGSDDAVKNAAAVHTYHGEHRMGHLSALQRSSRAADGTPMHIRMDGAGLSTLDVPDGSLQPKLEFTVFVPSAEFFRQMRDRQASLDLLAQYPVDPNDNGLERFITATRRQNYLLPPLRHRAFPLLEFA